LFVRLEEEDTETTATVRIVLVRMGAGISRLFPEVAIEYSLAAVTTGPRVFLAIACSLVGYEARCVTQQRSGDAPPVRPIAEQGLFLCCLLA
jgi:hypothetical protein